MQKCKMPKKDCPLCCHSFGTDEGIVPDVCKKCRKAARNVFKTYTSDIEFINHSCEHTKNRRRFIYKKGYSFIRNPGSRNCNIPFSTFTNNKHYEGPRSQCILCLDEMRKEINLRQRKQKIEKKTTERAEESLVTKCCKIIAVDPGLLLLASVNQPPLDNNLWKQINEQVPHALSKEYDQALNESEEVNDAHWMYQTIGEVFSRYIRRTRGRG